VEAFRQGDLKGTEHYLVPYNEMKKLVPEEDKGVIEEDVEATAQFSEAWEDAFGRAEDEYRKSIFDFWEHVFSEIGDCPPADVRGAHPGNALTLYVDSAHPSRTQELLLRLKQIHGAATTNSEGLRKLVKKFDKHGNAELSKKLLPKLYVSSFYAGQGILQDSIELIRELLDDPNDAVDRMMRRDSEARHIHAAEIRYDEIDWLTRLCSSIPHHALARLVAHRGFHEVKDRNDKRPLENSSDAFEIAWTSGIHLCECDIAMTKDEKLVLAHDDNFTRLALDSKSANSSKQVGDLTFQQLMSLRLKSGVRPPLLIDILRSARAISDNSQLVIEIKPGNTAAASALARLLIRHPDLRKAVAMIMSFDANTMHRLRVELGIVEVVEDVSAAPSVTQGFSRTSVSVAPSVTQGFGRTSMSIRPSISRNSMGMHRRLNSFDHFGNLTSFRGSLSLEAMGPIGLSLSQTGLDEGDKDSEEKEDSWSMPKLMLLTVADPPKIACELQVGLNDFSPVHNWLTTNDGSLDGVYLQFQKEMMTEEGARALRQLSERFLVGIWTYSGIDPDDFATFEWLVREGNCSFVNTDLPNSFRKTISVRHRSS